MPSLQNLLPVSTLLRRLMIWLLMLCAPVAQGAGKHDFDLAVTPGKVVVEQGGVTSATIHITGRSDSTVPVKLEVWFTGEHDKKRRVRLRTSMSGEGNWNVHGPEDALVGEWSWGATPGNGETSTSLLTITAPPDTVPGDYMLSIKGSRDIKTTYTKKDGLRSASKATVDKRTERSALLHVTVTDNPSFIKLIEPVEFSLLPDRYSMVVPARVDFQAYENTIYVHAPRSISSITLKLDSEKPAPGITAVLQWLGAAKRVSTKQFPVLEVRVEPGTPPGTYRVRINGTSRGANGKTYSDYTFVDLIVPAPAEAQDNKPGPKTGSTAKNSDGESATGSPLLIEQKEPGTSGQSDPGIQVRMDPNHSPAVNDNAGNRAAADKPASQAADIDVAADDVQSPYGPRDKTSAQSSLPAEPTAKSCPVCDALGRQLIEKRRRLAKLENEQTKQQNEYDRLNNLRLEAWGRRARYNKKYGFESREPSPDQDKLGKLKAASIAAGKEFDKWHAELHEHSGKVARLEAEAEQLHHDISYATLHYRACLKQCAKGEVSADITPAPDRQLYSYRKITTNCQPCKQQGLDTQFNSTLDKLRSALASLRVKQDKYASLKRQFDEIDERRGRTRNKLEALRNSGNNSKRLAQEPALIKRLDAIEQEYGAFLQAAGFSPLLLEIDDLKKSVKALKNGLDASKRKLIQCEKQCVVIRIKDVLNVSQNNPYNPTRPIDQTGDTTNNGGAAPAGGGGPAATCAAGFVNQGAFTVDGAAGCGTGAGNIVCTGGNTMTFLGDTFTRAGASATTAAVVNNPMLGAGVECSITPVGADPSRFQYICNTVLPVPFAICFQNYKQ